MKIVKKTKQIEYDKVISPAMYQERRTDRVKEVSVQGVDGVLRTEERPVYEKVFVEAVTEKAILEKLVYEVEVKGEVHSFASEEDAKSFMKGVK